MSENHSLEPCTRKLPMPRWLQNDCELYRMSVAQALDIAAAQFGVSLKQLRTHMAAVGFEPKFPFPYEHVKREVERLMKEPTCSNVGFTFMETRLRQVGIMARPTQVKRALKELNPEAHRKRAKAAAKVRYTYNVKGPRSLYHADAHEKIAKLFGIWVHGMIDGYSRFLIYLEARPNKRAAVVRDLFVKGACL